MGLPPDEEDISYDICLDLAHASWDEVSSRITSHPSEAIEEDCLHGNSPLEIMFKTKSQRELPLDVYRKILKEECEDDKDINEGIFVHVVRKHYSDEYMSDLTNLLLDFVKKADGRRLVEMSIWYGNVAAAKVFIERYPDSLKMKDKLKGQLPLHVACEESNEPRQAELIELLLTEGIKQNVGGKAGAGGLFEKDYKGTSPLMQVIHIVNNPFTWDSMMINMCVEAAFKSTSISGTGEKWEMDLKDGADQFHFPVLHEAMEISSPDAFYRIIEIVKEYDVILSGEDRRGRTALIKAIYLDAEERQRRTQYKRKTSTKEIIRMIIGAGTSDCAEVRDGAGRLPLHIAAEMGLQWDEGVREIAMANKDALEERHCVTGHYPFMTAAVGSDGDLDTTFELMRLKPSSLLNNHQSQPVQELSFHSIARKPVHWPYVPSTSLDSGEGNNTTSTMQSNHSDEGQ